jgi:hypothetical protein
MELIFTFGENNKASPSQQSSAAKDVSSSSLVYGDLRWELEALEYEESYRGIKYMYVTGNLRIGKCAKVVNRPHFFCYFVGFKPQLLFCGFKK